jgi:hypothetical protein
LGRRRARHSRWRCLACLPAWPAEVGGNAPPAASTAQDDLNAELFFEFVEVN